MDVVTPVNTFESVSVGGVEAFTIIIDNPIQSAKAATLIVSTLLPIVKDVKPVHE